MMTRECVPQLGLELDFDLCFLQPAAPGPGVLDGFFGTEKTTDQYKEQGKDKGKSLKKNQKIKWNLPLLGEGGGSAGNIFHFHILTKGVDRVAYMVCYKAKSV